jgi:hypothetical protein
MGHTDHDFWLCTMAKKNIVQNCRIEKHRNSNLRTRKDSGAQKANKMPARTTPHHSPTDHMLQPFLTIEDLDMIQLQHGT